MVHVVAPRSPPQVDLTSTFDGILFSTPGFSIEHGNVMNDYNMEFTIYEE